MNDPIADMLTRIRNASNSKHKTVDIPASNMKLSIAKILFEEGYIKSYEEIKEENNPKESLDLYEEIVELHSGDKNNPIKYKSGITFELGKYYTQNGVVYICFKDSTLVVEDDITKYLGIYVSIA